MQSGPLGVGVALPQTVGRSWVAKGSITEYARRAEQLGFDGLWVSELLTTRLLDPLALLAHCAAVTDQIRLGVAVVLADLRPPLRFARETATVDQLSQGRLTVGLGLGSDRGIYSAYGLSAERRAHRFDDGIAILKRLWQGEQVSYDGFWRLEASNSAPMPVQRPHPPLWFGARSVPALRRAVRHGDGWIGSGSESPAVFAANARVLTELLEEAGRDSGDFGTAKRVYIAVDGRDRRARERARSWFGTNYGRPELADEVVVVGTPERCASELDEIRRSGADELVLNPMFDEPVHLEVLAAEVVPLLTPPAAGRRSNTTRLPRNRSAWEASAVEAGPGTGGMER